MNKMKSMKAMSVNRMLGSFKKRASNSSSSSKGPSPAEAAAAAQHGATPEATVQSSVKAFCEAGGNSQGDDVLFLPPIVEAAESSPAAAAECALMIRKYMRHSQQPSWQYNAIMLVRILTDNPGETFTRNIDQKLVDTASNLLKGSKDPRVRQILMETLDDFERTRGYDVNLQPLVAMWQKEKEKALRSHGGRLPPPMPHRNLMQPQAPGFQAHGLPQSQNYFSRSHNNTRLPDPVELTSRLEEARTSAKLLEQVVMNTPPADFPNNELIREFADRCQSASRSIQGYMTSESPAPDNDTMESLIDTNEQLQTALNQHRRALLNARKQLGERTDSDGPPVSGLDASNAVYHERAMASGATDSAGPTSMGRGAMGHGKGKATETYAPSEESLPLPGGSGAAASGPEAAGLGPGYGAHLTAGSSRAARDDGAYDHDPFADPFRDPSARPSRDTGSRAGAYEKSEERHMYEPFNPGFSPAGEHPSKFDDERDTARLAVPRSQANAGGGASASSSRNSYQEVSDDDDLYSASPKVTEPAQRY